MPGKSAKQAQPASEPVDTVAEALSPKTKKVVLAQSRILTQDSVSKRLLEVTSWVDVQAQLSTQSAPDINPCVLRFVSMCQETKVTVS